MFTSTISVESLFDSPAMVNPSTARFVPKPSGTSDQGYAGED